MAQNKRFKLNEVAFWSSRGLHNSQLFGFFSEAVAWFLHIHERYVTCVINSSWSDDSQVLDVRIEIYLPCSPDKKVREKALNFGLRMYKNSSQTHSEIISYVLCSTVSLSLWHTRMHTHTHTCLNSSRETPTQVRQCTCALYRLHRGSSAGEEMVGERECRQRGEGSFTTQHTHSVCSVW